MLLTQYRPHSLNEHIGAGRPWDLDRGLAGGVRIYQPYRGRFVTDANGQFRFRSVKPAGYPIPTHGPTGDLLRAQHRHNFRPAHLHFLAFKPGYQTLITQIFVNDDEYLRSDVVFGVTRSLIGDYIRHDKGEAPPVAEVVLVRRAHLDAVAVELGVDVGAVRAELQLEGDEAARDRGRR